MLGSFWDRSGIVLGSFWARFGIVLGSFRDRFGIVSGSFWGQSNCEHCSIMLPVSSRPAPEEIKSGKDGVEWECHVHVLVFAVRAHL